MRYNMQGAPQANILWSASTPRSTPGARGEELRIGGHFYTIVQHLGTTSFPRTGRISHDHSDASVLISIFAPAVRIINKTLSTDAAAWAVPPAIGPDRPSPSWARSEQMRSMFSVFVSLFELCSPRARLQGRKCESRCFHTSVTRRERALKGGCNARAMRSG